MIPTTGKTIICKGISIDKIPALIPYFIKLLCPFLIVVMDIVLLELLARIGLVLPYGEVVGGIADLPLLGKFGGADCGGC